MNKNIEKLLETAVSEIGYREKKNANNLDDKNANAGNNNYTKYGRDLSKWTNSGNTYGINYQWCDQFYDWLLCKCFGIDKAKRLLIGWSAYTPTSAQYYKNKKQWYKIEDAEPGDQIFFKNSIRIHHTGIVYKIDAKNKIVYTIEGNTNPGSGVEADGGKVSMKSYSFDNKRIAGVGRPDWSILEEDETEVGWHKDEVGTWYRHTKGTGQNTYYHSVIKEINGKIYAFNEGGYLIKSNKELIHIDNKTGEIYFKR